MFDVCGALWLDCWLVVLRFGGVYCCLFLSWCFMCLVMVISCFVVSVWWILLLLGLPQGTL